MAVFGTASKAALAECLPQLQLIANEAIKEIDFRVLDGMRTWSEQEKFFKAGTTKVHAGHSAHNFKPAVAFDLFAAPYDWKPQPFIVLSHVILRIAKAHSIPLRWGGDFNMDGNKTMSDSWDPGHYELHPWREWAEKYSKPYKG